MLFSLSLVDHLLLHQGIIESQNLYPLHCVVCAVPIVSALALGVVFDAVRAEPLVLDERYCRGDGLQYPIQALEFRLRISVDGDIRRGSPAAASCLTAADPLD